MTSTLAIAPHFHLAGDWDHRLLIADRQGWRPPGDAELTTLVCEPRTREELAGCACLFALPAHLHSSFWSMLERQAAEGDGDFVAFAEEVTRFLTFKMMPPPAGSAFELVLRTAGSAFDAAGIWAVVNLSDDAVSLAWPGLRLNLGRREGCRSPGGSPPDVLPPVGEEIDVLLVIRGN
jgi:hypothetical protein